MSDPTNILQIQPRLSAASTPGYKTTEFWLKLVAIFLTAAFASGLIPTTGTAATIAAIAATMLGALGYTVSRSMVKAAAVTPTSGQLLDSATFAPVAPDKAAA